MSRHVVLLRRDPSLGLALRALLHGTGRVTELINIQAWSALQVDTVDAVVIDLPVSRRKQAVDLIRSRFKGRLVLVLDPIDDPAGVPSHHHCSVVQRPFEIVELWHLVTTDPEVPAPRVRFDEDPGPDPAGESPAGSAVEEQPAASAVEERPAAAGRTGSTRPAASTSRERDAAPTGPTASPAADRHRASASEEAPGPGSPSADDASTWRWRGRRYGPATAVPPDPVGGEQGTGTPGTGGAKPGPRTRDPARPGPAASPGGTPAVPAGPQDQPTAASEQPPPPDPGATSRSEGRRWGALPRRSADPRPARRLAGEAGRPGEARPDAPDPTDPHAAGTGRPGRRQAGRRRDQRGHQPAARDHRTGRRLGSAGSRTHQGARCRPQESARCRCPSRHAASLTTDRPTGEGSRSRRRLRPRPVGTDRTSIGAAVRGRFRSSTAAGSGIAVLDRSSRPRALVDPPPAHRPPGRAQGGHPGPGDSHAGPERSHRGPFGVGPSVRTSTSIPRGSPAAPTRPSRLANIDHPVPPSPGRPPPGPDHPAPTGSGRTPTSIGRGPAAPRRSANTSTHATTCLGARALPSGADTLADPDPSAVGTPDHDRTRGRASASYRARRRCRRHPGSPGAASSVLAQSTDPARAPDPAHLQTAGSARCAPRPSWSGGPPAPPHPAGRSSRPARGARPASVPGRVAASG